VPTHQRAPYLDERLLGKNEDTEGLTIYNWYICIKREVLGVYF